MVKEEGLRQHQWMTGGAHRPLYREPEFPFEGLTRIHTCMSTSVHACAHTHTRMHAYAQTVYVHTHTHIHKHTHTHTQITVLTTTCCEKAAPRLSVSLRLMLLIDEVQVEVILVRAHLVADAAFPRALLSVQ